MSARTWMVLTVVVGGLLAGSEANGQCTPHTINVNGQSGDWAGLFHFLDMDEPAITDGQDLQAVYLTNDATHLYVAFQTYASTTGVSEAQVFLDLPPLNPTSFGAEDRVLRIRYNTSNGCQSLAVTNASGGGNSWPAGRCRSNYARSGSFTEVRVPLSVLGLSACPRIGVAVYLSRRNGGSNDISPGQPWPTFMPYDNSGTLTPTLARFRSVRAEALGGGVRLQWETAAEWTSLGTRVLREAGPAGWLEVGAVAPSPSPTGGRHAVFDGQGRVGDRYRIVETDASGRESAVETHATRLVPSRRALAPMMSLLAAPEVERPPYREAKVQVTSEGPVLLCGKDLATLGWAPADVPVVTRGGDPVRVFRAASSFAGCDGYVFWARAPGSPFAAFETYQLRPGPDGGLSWLRPALTGPVPAHAQASAVRVSPVADVWPDQTVADLGRYFSGYLTQARSLSVATPDRVGDRLEVRLEARELFGRPATLRLDVDGVRAGEVAAGTLDYAPAGFVASAAPGENPVLGLTLAAPAVVTLSRVAVRYSARLAPRGSLLVFETEAPGWFLAAVDAPFAALDVTSEPAAPAAAVWERGQGAVESLGARRLAIVPAGSLQPALLKALAPGLELRPEADYVVLAKESLLPSLKPLLDLRAATGHQVAAVALESVYDRFSGSQPTPEAIRAFVSWARQGEVPLQHLLVVGSTSYDPTGRTTQRPADAPVLPVLFPELRLRTLSDAALVADPAGSPAVAIGRLPTSDPSQIDAYVRKVLDWESRSASQTVLAWSGTPQAGDPDFATLAEVLASAVGGSSQPLTDASGLGQSWQEASVVAYVGHGAGSFWDWVAGAPVLGTSSLRLEAERAPVVLSAACQDAGPTSMEMTMAFAMLDAPVGQGAIAYVGQSGLGDPNEAAGVLNAVLLSRATTWGGAWVEALRAVPNATGRSSLFVGDPALRREPLAPVSTRLTRGR